MAMAVCIHSPHASLGMLRCRQEGRLFLLRQPTEFTEFFGCTGHVGTLSLSSPCCHFPRQCFLVVNNDICVAPKDSNYLDICKGKKKIPPQTHYGERLMLYFKYNWYPNRVKAAGVKEGHTTSQSNCMFTVNYPVIRN